MVEYNAVGRKQRKGLCNAVGKERRIGAGEARWAPFCPPFCYRTTFRSSCKVNVFEGCGTIAGRPKIIISGDMEECGK
eukprot:scaffold35584_cov20-Tisochrysis_lutea.AAC.1